MKVCNYDYIKLVIFKLHFNTRLNNAIIVRMYPIPR